LQGTALAPPFPALKEVTHMEDTFLSQATIQSLFEQQIRKLTRESIIRQQGMI